MDSKITDMIEGSVSQYFNVLNTAKYISLVNALKYIPQISNQNVSTAAGNKLHINRKVKLRLPILQKSRKYSKNVTRKINQKVGSVIWQPLVETKIILHKPHTHKRAQFHRKFKHNKGPGEQKLRI